MKLKTQKKNRQEGFYGGGKSGWRIIKGQRRHFKGPINSKYGEMYKGEGLDEEDAYQDYIEDNCSIDRTCKEHCKTQGLKNRTKCIDKDRILYKGAVLKRGLCGSRNKDETKECTPACDILSWTDKERKDGAETIKKMTDSKEERKSTVLRENDKLNLKYQLCNSSPKCYMKLKTKGSYKLGNCGENKFKKRNRRSWNNKMMKASKKANIIITRIKKEQSHLKKPCNDSKDNHCKIYNVDYLKKLYHILREDVKERRNATEEKEVKDEDGKEILKIYKFEVNGEYNTEWWKTNVGLGNWDTSMSSNKIEANVAEDNLTKVFTEYIINTVKQKNSNAFGDKKHIYSEETETLKEDIKSAVTKVINLMGKMDLKPVSECAEAISPYLAKIDKLEKQVNIDTLRKEIHSASGKGNKQQINGLHWGMVVNKEADEAPPPVPNKKQKKRKLNPKIELTDVPKGGVVNNETVVGDGTSPTVSSNIKRNIVGDGDSSSIHPSDTILSLKDDNTFYIRHSKSTETPQYPYTLVLKLEKKKKNEWVRNTGIYYIKKDEHHDGKYRVEWRKAGEKKKKRVLLSNPARSIKEIIETISDGNLNSNLTKRDSTVLFWDRLKYIEPNTNTEVGQNNIHTNAMNMNPSRVSEPIKSISVGPNAPVPHIKKNRLRALVESELRKKNLIISLTQSLNTK
jgi:hypothetical protein